MPPKAQREYYNMPPAGQALEARVSALSGAIPKGSVVLDIGCNDGSISNHLLDAGVISKSYCFDLEDILTHRRPEIQFEAANLREYELSRLPEANGVMILNLLHHIVGSSKDRAKELIDYLISRYDFVLIDMGSFSENGEWYWRRAYSKYWKSDAEMWEFLFEKARWRFKLLRYPTQGQGYRTLWKLYREPYELSRLETLETFKRPPGAWPEGKKLIPSAEVGATAVVNSVEFELARSGRGDKFWVKKYGARMRAIRADLEMRLASHAAQELASLNPRMHCDLRASVPVSAGQDGSLRFLFEPDVFSGSIVHFQDWPAFFSAEQCRAAAVLGTRPLELVKGLPKMMLLHACDYQICATWDGLTALDFEPNNWVVRLASLDLLRKPDVERHLSALPMQGAESIGASDLPAAVTELKAEIRDLRRAISRLRRDLSESKQ
jgi:hypothetical protein